MRDSAARGPMVVRLETRSVSADAILTLDLYQPIMVAPRPSSRTSGEAAMSATATMEP